MNCYDKHLCNIVYIEIGEIVREIPEDRLVNLLKMLPCPFVGLER